MSEYTRESLAKLANVKPWLITDVKEFEDLSEVKPFLIDMGKKLHRVHIEGGVEVMGHSFRVENHYRLTISSPSFRKSKNG